MSTKFNRNDPEAGNDKFYHDDYKVDLNGVEQDRFEDVQDFEELPCIVSGLDLTPEDYPSTTVAVAAGIARDKDGKRIQVPEDDSVTITDTGGGNNYVILKHKYSKDTPRNAYSTGVSYDTRQYDDYELEVAATYEAGDIVLGNVKVIGGVNVLYLEERTHPVYKPTSGDTTPPTDPSNLVLTTGIMGNDDIPLYDKTKYVAKAERLAWIKAAWDASIDTGSGLANYEIYLIPLSKSDVELLDKRQEQKVKYSASDPRTDITFQNLTPGVKYRVKVRAIDNCGNLSNFIQDDVIAGGSKEIPDACADVLDSEPTITADDDGIRINWAVKSEYQEKVIGFEFCWTDDGVTNPDFDNKNHRQIFTKRNFIVLPAKMSSEDATITIKAKMRAVDRSGQHCTTPKTLPDTNAKKYPADLSAFATELKNARGNTPSLNARLNVGIDADGILKPISEMESEIASSRGGYPTLKDRIDALASAGVDWKYVRIVAKDSQFSTIQAAVNSIPDYTSGTPNKYALLIMPGIYEEVIDIQGKAWLMFFGFGAVVLGTLKCQSALDDYHNLIYMEGMRIINTTSEQYATELACADNVNESIYPIFKNCYLINESTNAGDYALKIVGGRHLKIYDSYFRASGANNWAVDIGLSAGNGHIKLKGSTFICGNVTVGSNGVVTMQSGGETTYIYDCVFNAASDLPAMYQASGIVKFAHNRYTTAPAGAATYDFGTLDNISNVLFDNDDLVEFDDWSVW